MSNTLYFYEFPRIYSLFICLYGALNNMVGYMQYHMMRLFLTSREVPPIIEALKRELTSRKQYLINLFGTEKKFLHRGKPYVYTYFHTVENRFIAGVIGRERSVTVHASPEEKYHPVEVPDWETVNIIIDISGEADGQKVAMQERNNIGSPLHILRSLTDHINDNNIDSDWLIAVNSITRENEFWQTVEQYKGRISEMDMTFITPNIWNGSTETEGALRELHDINKAQSVEIRLKNPDKNLQPDSTRIRESVDYITRGGGSIQLKTDGKTVYSSEDKIVKQSAGEDDVSVQDALYNLLVALVNRLFGR